MNEKLKRTIENLSEMDAYMNKNIRSTYIDHIVYKLKLILII